MEAICAGLTKLRFRCNSVVSGMFLIGLPKHGNRAAERMILYRHISTGCQNQRFFGQSAQKVRSRRHISTM